jgi:hypothetical protein
MKYDLIIACGDSFTEGCQDTLKIPVEQTWPGLLAESLGIPFVNLAIGGSCNLEIALQPLKSASPAQLEIIHKAKCPLILFNFTVMERMPYASLRAGFTESCFSILPEHTEGLRISYIDNTVKEMLIDNFVNLDTECAWDAYSINQSDDNRPDRNIDWFVFSTMQAIRTCMNWEKLIPNSTVAWGFIHINTSLVGNGLDQYFNMFGDNPHEQKLNYPYLDRCYNKCLNMKEVQSILYDEHLQFRQECIIAPHDVHPNPVGIGIIAKWFEDYISENL